MKASDFKRITNDHYDRWKFTEDGRFPKAKLKKTWKKKRNRHQRAIEKRFAQKEIREAAGG